MTLSILLADDHVLVRQGLRLVLESEADLRVAGEAADGLEALERARELNPDIVVLDVMLPALNGLEVVRRLGEERPDVKTVMLSMHTNEAYVCEALRNGALGYVLKSSAAADLVRAVRRAARGCRYLSPPLSEIGLEQYLERERSGAADPYESLTDRERQVLQLAAEGLTSTEIGERLGISPRTAESHRSSLMQKLRLRNRAELVRWAIRRGITTAES